MASQLSFLENVGKANFPIWESWLRKFSYIRNLGKATFLYRKKTSLRRKATSLYRKVGKHKYSTQETLVSHLSYAGKLGRRLDFVRKWYKATF